jgi:hypothetical protein
MALGVIGGGAGGGGGGSGSPRKSPSLMTRNYKDTPYHETEIVSNRIISFYWYLFGFGAAYHVLL